MAGKYDQMEYQRRRKSFPFFRFYQYTPAGEMIEIERRQFKNLGMARRRVTFYAHYIYHGVIVVSDDEKTEYWAKDIDGDLDPAKIWRKLGCQPVLNFSKEQIARAPKNYKVRQLLEKWRNYDANLKMTQTEEVR